MAKKTATRIRHLATSVVITLGLLGLTQAVVGSNVDTQKKWAWASNVGWINFKPANEGVTVYPDHLEGYAWAENIGWIRLGTHTEGGIHRYENTTSTDYGVNRDGVGDLSGYAWSSNVGWINFRPQNGGVSIDSTTGSFDGFAWAENAGWIHFKNADPAYNVAFSTRTYRVHLPLVLRGWLPIPAAPDLLSIANSDGDGAYAVNWSTAPWAETYELQEATSSSFEDARGIYPGSSTSHHVSGKGAARYYYRVRARNSQGISAWSVVQWVDVLWEAEPNDSAILANGPLVSGLTYFGAFPHGDGDNDYFLIDMREAGKIEVWLQKIPDGSNYDLVLRDDSSGWPAVGYSGEKGNADEHIEAPDLPDGRYYIQIYNRGASGSSQAYHLRVVFD